ncbi:RluA family pseudouridine synthase [Liquorilactobacillus capillatus]|uniref:Pseudouridine synthase n=1 Tax=Liquorilactobacillus capillatus DSM 19910 TaxID=1423731 RepID=A0A0R1LXP2_9LACO|nr:RluA family pseudouridine synthase [Liquorilactobacillus capillatus]KRL00470.1 ribosomal large subunit pseudouridine synthase D [Liquorilactobacillus capillatus DSM 19910]
MQYTWKNNKKEMTIKRFLVECGVSHRLLRQIKQGEGTVVLDEQQVPLATPIAKGEEIMLRLPPENHPEVPAATGELTILLENSNWLVVAKPAGMTSVPGPSNRTTTLVNYVKGYLLNNQEEDLVPHIITRLDRFTSGAVLIAKNRLAQGLVNKQVEGKMLEKQYLAVIKGQLPRRHGVIEQPIGREDQQIKRKVMAKGQYAKTEYWVLSANDEASLLKLKLHTGRTHQIRVHLAYVGHPLVGDELYGGEKQALIARQALHAYTIGYTDPFTRRVQKVTAPLPLEMQKLCNKFTLDLTSIE